MGELEIFSIRIKELRESFCMTQKDFSQYVGIKQQTLSGYERGLMKPPLDIITEIAKKTLVSIDWLCGLSDNKYIDNQCIDYSDIIKILFKLEKYTELSINFSYELINCGTGLTGYPDYQEIDVGHIYFSDINIDNFLKEWQKMRDLHNNKTIDDELYMFWTEKVINKYSNILIKANRPDNKE